MDSTLSFIIVILVFLLITICLCVSIIISINRNYKEINNKLDKILEHYGN